MQNRVVRSLRDAASALEALGFTSVGSADLRSAAERIETSETDSLTQSEELRAGLSAAEGQLRERRVRAERSSVVELALGELEESIERIEANAPLLDQRPAIGRAFRALADAMFLEAGQDAPFAGRAPEPRSVAERLEEARADVLALGSAGLSDIRALASSAMHSLADLVAALGRQDDMAGRSAEIRAEARRLARDSREPFARAGWVAAGLRAALAALDEMQATFSCPVEGSARVEDWTRMARRATEKLPERGALPFEHAAIQDAFRATLDAIGVALLNRELCASRANEPAPGRSSDG